MWHCLLLHFIVFTGWLWSPSCTVGNVSRGRLRDCHWLAAQPQAESEIETRFLVLTTRDWVWNTATVAQQQAHRDYLGQGCQTYSPQPRSGLQNSVMWLAGILEGAWIWEWDPLLKFRTQSLLGTCADGEGGREEASHGCISPHSSLTLLIPTITTRSGSGSGSQETLWAGSSLRGQASLTSLVQRN